MIDNFSSGYYSAQMSIQGYDGGPTINRTLHKFINNQLYSDNDVPVMMRLSLDESRAFSVSPESSVPKDVLALPHDMFDSFAEERVFILKPDHIKRLYNG
jgi:hypothetical protein